MRRSRFSEEQIIGILKEHQAGLSAAELGRKRRLQSSPPSHEPRGNCSTGQARTKARTGLTFDRGHYGEQVTCRASRRHVVTCCAFPCKPVAPNLAKTPAKGSVILAGQPVRWRPHLLISSSSTIDENAPSMCHFLIPG
jgi:hypothetical protein